jgi:DNA recombination protein RmuC
MNQLTFLSQSGLILLAAGGLIGAFVAYLFLSARSGKIVALLKAENLALEKELAQSGAVADKTVGRIEALLAENAGLTARLESERERYAEQIQLLQQTRENLSREFENLANRIFEEKQSSFSRHSKLALDAAVNPLREDLTSFRKQVETAYTHENAERNKLWGQIQELKTQAQRIGEDAVQLTRALKGDSKMQGNWGEVILERLLEESGLKKGREYETQVNLKSEDGGRRNPDVVIHLPDRRDIVIDAKVSLVDYERYCRSDDNDERQRFLRAHLTSIRAHITGLNRKAYEDLEGINSLDFVLIFIPIEAAFMVAVEHDDTLFMDAYDRGIILVSPSTLLATLRTVSNIWRYEYQNQNAEKIAARAGALYDQFALVVESIDEIGKHLAKGQEAWQTTRNRLVDGRGNVVRRLEEIKKMGARTRRILPADLTEKAGLQMDDDDVREDDVS